MRNGPLTASALKRPRPLNSLERISAGWRQNQDSLAALPCSFEPGAFVMQITVKPGRYAQSAAANAPIGGGP